MMIDGRRYSNNLLVRLDPDLRAQLAAAAERERVSVSELALAQQASKEPQCST
jgi:predicted HicB family RNase H-like nuclease